MWLVNLKMEDLKKLKRHSLIHRQEDRLLALQYRRVVQFCVKHGVCAGRIYSKND
ncbi:hypothetical protein Hanom_Chr16g01501961 [Helianthus anomalus]